MGKDNKKKKKKKKTVYVDDGSTIADMSGVYLFVNESYYSFV